MFSSKPDKCDKKEQERVTKLTGSERVGIYVASMHDTPRRVHVPQAVYSENLAFLGPLTGDTLVTCRF